MNGFDKSYLIILKLIYVFGILDILCAIITKDYSSVPNFIIIIGINQILYELHINRKEKSK